MKIVNYLRHLNRKRNHATNTLKRSLRLYFTSRKLAPGVKGDILPNHYKRILFPFVDLGIGDAVCHTGLWQRLKELGYRIQIIAEKRNEFLFRNIDCVDEVYIVDINCISDFKKVDTEIVVCMYSWMKRKQYLEIQLLKKINYHYAISVGGWIKKPFNVIIPLPRKFHITTPQIIVLNHLGHTTCQLGYRIPTLRKSNEFIESYLQKFQNKKIVVINPFASVIERSMTHEQIGTVLSKLSINKNIHFFVIGQQEKLKQLNFKFENISLCLFNSLWDAISLIKKSDLVISVDTSIVHIACAFKKNLIGIYYSENIDYNPNLPGNFIFSPNTSNAQQIIFNNNQIPFDTDTVIERCLSNVLFSENH